MPAGFASRADTIAFGGPVVRLFRTVLGRDPAPAELLSHAGRLEAGEALEALAAVLLATGEAVARHGGGDAVDASFAAALGRDATGVAARGTELLGTVYGASRAVLAATLADGNAARRHVPLLPGLAPGAAPDDPVAYGLWRTLYADRPAPGEGGAPDGTAQAGGTPMVFATRAGDSEVEALLATIASLRDQTDARWHLHVACRLLSEWPRRALARAASDTGGRMTVHATEAGDPWDVLPADTAADTLLAFVDPGDLLEPDALAAVAARFGEAPGAAVLFTDEDDGPPDRPSAPRFRPLWFPESAMHADAQLAVMRAFAWRAAVHAVPPGTVPAGLGTVVARAAAPGTVLHLPRILLHRAPGRAAPSGSAPRPPAAAELDRAAEAGPAGRSPRVAVLLPTRNRAALLEQAARGVLEDTDYDALALHVIDNGSDEADALAVLDRLAATPRVVVRPAPGPFNYARLNNEAAAAAGEAEILLLLNNDVVVRHRGWLRALVALAARPDVGAVGARLLYPDGTLQHAGMLLGPDGAATHVGRHAAADAPGYGGRYATVQELSAVTGACLAIRRSVWEAVGGMDEALAVAWNDVDLCLRVRRAGFRVLWTPFATLTHLEGQTRGREAADAREAARFRDEQARVRALWGDAVEHDPFLNPNLIAAENGALGLARPRGRARREAGLNHRLP